MNISFSWTEMVGICSNTSNSMVTASSLLPLLLTFKSSPFLSPPCSSEMNVHFTAATSNSVGLLLRTSLRLLIRARTCHRSSASKFAGEKPRAGWVKLNFDGASKQGASIASIGGVCRDHEGLFMLGYAERIGPATSSVAELAACKRGIELALQHGWRKVWIEGDAKVVVDWLMDNAKLKAKEDLQVGRGIGLLIPKLREFKASHVYRRENRVAHRFAKLGYECRNPRVWRGVPPGEVDRLLRQDAAAAATFFAADK